MFHTPAHKQTNAASAPATISIVKPATRPENLFTRLNEGVEHYDFGVLHGYRVVGCRIQFSLYVIEEGGKVWNYKTRSLLPAGTYYAWNGQATRRGLSYGPIQDTHYETSSEARIAGVEKYLKAAKARALNNKAFRQA